MVSGSPIEAVLIGAGQRGAEVYAPYALTHPQELRFVAVAEPRTERRERFARQHNVPPERCFSSWEELLAHPALGQAALITTQDALHTGPAVAAMRAGYHVLLEKPMALTLADCEALVKVSQQTGRQLHVCHVLRYTRHMRQMREIIQSGLIGEVVDVDHRENIAFWHMAHSYVRGNWGLQGVSGPMILTKCVHDLDILPWLLERKPQQLSSTGGLLHFSAKNAPENAPERCVDGCPEAETCPYYAPHMYLGLEPFWHSYAETAAKGAPRWAAQNAADKPGLVRFFSLFYPPLRQVSDYRGWPLSVVADDPTPENILEALMYGPYGRCVYRCGSDVVDHQVVNMLFEGGATVTLTMHGHSPVEHRSTRIEGTRGRLTGQLGNGGAWLEVDLHRPRRKLHFDTSAGPFEGHGGGDAQLMADFIACVRRGGNPPEVLAAAQEALQAHRLAFWAEQARAAGKVIRVGEMEAAGAVKPDVHEGRKEKKKDAKKHAK